MKVTYSPDEPQRKVAKVRRGGGIHPVDPRGLQEVGQLRGFPSVANPLRRAARARKLHRPRAGQRGARLQQGES